MTSGGQTLLVSAILIMVFSAGNIFHNNNRCKPSNLQRSFYRLAWDFSRFFCPHRVHGNTFSYVICTNWLSASEYSSSV